MLSNDCVKDTFKQFFYYSGLGTMRTQINDEEHVAMATFGHECKVQQRLTNNLSKLTHIFGKCV